MIFTSPPPSIRNQQNLSLDQVDQDQRHRQQRIHDAALPVHMPRTRRNLQRHQNDLRQKLCEILQKGRRVLQTQRAHRLYHQHRRVHVGGPGAEEVLSSPSASVQEVLQVPDAGSVPGVQEVRHGMTSAELLGCAADVSHW